MVKLEDITVNAQLHGILSDSLIHVVQVIPVGDDAVTLIYKDQSGKLGEQMLFRSDEHKLELVTKGKSWAFDAAGEEFKLGLEAYRISQAALFDPMMAIHTSNVDPLPHQISAVYESMLPRQPLRYVLADDPGAGKTIMAGLLIRELLMRADARRILVVAPGSLTEQWQDELREKFNVEFEIFSRDKQEQCVSGNYFSEADLLICRLDQLSRNEAFQEKIQNTEWDLIIVDEAHKLSANYFGNKVNKTRRFLLGELLGSITRHFLLMTATPHNGKEEDFQIWLSLLDSDRFYGKFREGAHKVDVSDMMRRMVKEELLKFDGTRLFPERRAYTANYELSDREAALYAEVTEYVREEMNRADRLGGQNKNNVGFALTMLQRRLASSPEAIYQSLKRRRKKLEAKLEEAKLLARGKSFNDDLAETYPGVNPNVSAKIPGSLADMDDFEEDLTAEEFEAFTDEFMDRATASATITELEAEIQILNDLEHKAHQVVLSGSDKKWDELSSLLQGTPEMFTEEGSRRKLIIFTEHTDTMKYLVSRIQDMLGSQDAVRTIYGGTNRDQRRKIQEEFRNDKEVVVLIATDAAGEGVNLQTTNLMVNYDLPWNPNRLEQRFGRIHRIGQTEVCHLWNMVASETREGEVFQKLFDKIEIEREALGGKVFDILGEAFENVSLRHLLIDAIRYGESSEAKAKMNEKLDKAMDHKHLEEVVKRNALVDNRMGIESLYSVKEEMEKAEARKLQPYFVRSFFNEAFKALGGQLRNREKGRYEINYVPPAIRERDRKISDSRTPVLRKYERVTFEKDQVRLKGKPTAELMHPTHPLMHATTDLILSAYRAKLKQGAVLVDPNDDSLEPKVLFMVDHSIMESPPGAQVASRRLYFVALDEKGHAENAGNSPHLDLQPIGDYDRQCIQDKLSAAWLNEGVEHLALRYAAAEPVPDHVQEIRQRREKQVDKTHQAVRERLIKEINYQQGQAIKLENDIAAGKKPRIHPEQLKRKAEELTARLEQREQELTAMRNLVPGTPVIIGGALVIPQGLLAERKGEARFSVDAAARSRIERIAMTAVMDTEKQFGHTVFDVGAEKCGWDVTARPKPLADGSIPPDRHIEVKGRAKGQSTITVTRNEINYALNQSDQFILAIVIVDTQSPEEHSIEGPFYIKNPFSTEPDSGVASINYDLKDLLSQAMAPEQSL